MEKKSSKGIGILVCILLLIFPNLNAQIIVDDFNNGVLQAWVPGSSKIKLKETDGILEVTANAVGSSYEGFGKTFSPIDMSKHSKITMKIMVPTGIVAPKFRMDVTDNNGFDTNKSAIIFNLIADSIYHTYTFDYKGKFQSSFPALNNLNANKIVRVYCYLNPGSTNFTGKVYLDDIVLEEAQSPNITDFKTEWKYFENGSFTDNSWTDKNFDDASWKSDTAEFGFGDGDEKTLIDFGVDPSNKNITSYFRKDISFVDTSAFQNLILQLKSADGAIIYLNGSEILRKNMPSGSVSSTTLALSEIQNGLEESKPFKIILPESLLDSGLNVLSAEIHLASVSSADMSFDLELKATTYKKGIIRGPYLQSGSDTSIVIRWRTLEPENGRIRFGTNPNSLASHVDSLGIKNDHEIVLTGLSPGVKYYYCVGSLTDTFSGPDNNHYFITSPSKGSDSPSHFWVIGDAGKTTNEQRSVKDAFVNYIGQTPVNGWLVLGDNAYNNGLDEEYQYCMFENMFEDVMKHTVMWPTPGNHDLGGYADPIKDAPYYQIFTVPVKGEAGGVPSGTKAYYSFDHANIRFVSLDSYGTPRDSTAAMAAWLKNDLAQTTQKWIIAFFHHPPYSKGTHDSDAPTSQAEDVKMAEMRAQILPLLEKFGVDLVLNGHSHVYERSYMIHGHYGLSSTFHDHPHIVNGEKSGKKSEGEEYYKNPQHDQYANKGTVFSVIGCSGLKSSSVLWAGQPGNLITNSLMYISSNTYVGSMVLKVEKDTLTCNFIDNAGVVKDNFTMIKDNTKDITLVQAAVNSVENKIEYDFNFKAYPNPTSGKLNISYNLLKTGYVELNVINSSGKRIQKVVSERQDRGDHQKEINLEDVANGVYTLMLTVDNVKNEKKIVRIR